MLMDKEDCIGVFKYFSLYLFLTLLGFLIAGMFPFVQPKGWDIVPFVLIVCPFIGFSVCLVALILEELTVGAVRGFYALLNRKMVLNACAGGLITASFLEAYMINFSVSMPAWWWMFYCIDCLLVIGLFVAKSNEYTRSLNINETVLDL